MNLLGISLSIRIDRDRWVKPVNRVNRLSRSIRVSLVNRFDADTVLAFPLLQRTAMGESFKVRRITTMQPKKPHGRAAFRPSALSVELGFVV